MLIGLSKKKAKDQTKSYSKRAIESILEHFYMDDFLDLFSSQTEAITTCKEISKILKKGGFHFTKYVSNEREILKSFPQDNLSANCQSVILDLDKIPLERALGINDTIKVKAVMKPFPPSKKGLLSFISSAFDPSGHLTPSMLEAKLIFQQLWKISLDWDEEIPSNLNNSCLKWLQALKNIEKVKLPRWYGFSFKNIKNIELHVFADASSCAYRTITYFRFIQEHNV